MYYRDCGKPVLVHQGIWAGEGSLADIRPTDREAKMPCFKPFSATGNSGRRRVGGRSRIVVRRCTRTVQMAVYAGFPAALNGIFAAKEVFRRRDAANDARDEG